MFMNFMRNGFREFDIKEEIIMEQPLLYTSFVTLSMGHDKAYMPVRDMAQLKEVLE